MYSHTSIAGLALAQATCAPRKIPTAPGYLFLLLVGSWLLLGTLTAFAKAPSRYQITDTPTVPASDSLALVALYNSTDGANWYDKTDWLTGPVNTWSGVSVINGRVTNISLLFNGLIGTIPSELGNLTSLQSLDLSFNLLSGALPASLGNLTSLRELILRINQLSGSIPAELGNLTSLQTLDIMDNQLSGTLPASLGNLTSLQSLMLSGNQLSGSIPASLGNLTNLRWLDISSTQLSGSIPAELGNLASLQRFNLINNQLNGSIPASLGNLASLQSLGLSGNQLSGSIPAELGNLASLQEFGLSENQLSGSIPAELGNLTSLGMLRLSNNQLSGSIPASLGNLTSLPELDLSNNQLNGSIPASLGNLTSLGMLGLSGNQLSGSVPASLGNLTSLGWLALADNQLISLPTFYQTSLNLTVFNNRLTFESLEANAKLLSYSSSYSPQDSVGTGANIVLSGQPGQLSTLVGGANNRYQWTRNGVDMDGATNATLTVTEAGVYSCRITNTVITGLTLYRRRVNVSGDGGVQQQSQTISFNALPNKTVGDAPFALTATASSGLAVAYSSSNTGVATVSGNTLTIVGAGATTITASQAGDSNYAAAAPVSQPLTVNVSARTVPASDSLALVALYNSTNGANWTIKDNWLMGKVNTWHGVTVANGRVVFIQLAYNQLNGTIPAALGNLSAVGYINFAGNQLMGSIPSEMGNLAALEQLNLGFNQLTGSIPDSFGNLSALLILYLPGNQLSGNIPADLGKLTSLKHLYLGNNQFTGLPAFTNLLQYFYLGFNRLTFESLEPNIGRFTSAEGYSYSPQDSVLAAANIVLAAGQSTQLSALVGGANNRYQWTRDGVDIAGATQATLTVIEAGTYGCKITNTVVTGLTLYRRQVKVSVTGGTFCQASGTILRELWTNIAGDRVTDIPLLSPPTSSSQLTSLEATANSGDRYGQRLRGYICAPLTGTYTFWIVSDNEGQLFLSSDADPAHKQSIASIQEGNAYPGQWTKYASQQSATIQLVAGQKYYVEVLHKEGTGGDHLIVGWRTPASAANAKPVVVPGSVLSPFVPVVVSACVGTGNILREYWANVNGDLISNIPVNTTPTSTSLVSDFEGATNVADKYAARYRGYVCVPTTGQYRFAVAGDNEVELWLSTGENAAGKQRIAFIAGGYANSRQWTKYPSQQSVPIQLVAGQKYYVEALHKEGTGGDNFSVAWQVPGSTAYSVVPGAYLIPFLSNAAREAVAEESITLQAFPNPFSSEVTVRFTAPSTGRASLDLYDLQGIRLKALFEGGVEAGESHQVVVEGSTLSNGLYLIRLVNGNQVSHLKVVLAK